MIIERADTADVPDLLALQKLAYRSEAAIYDDYTIPPLTQTLDEIGVDFERQIYLKATVNGEIVGAVRGYIDQGTCYVGRLIVHPDHQNQGIGTRLIGAIEAHFDGAARFELFTGFRSERNLYLYQKLGYREYRRAAVTPALELVYLEKLNE
ncbi:MAG: GNAT family N-acetyltransferase [Anaerolineae bacterium]|nr:GNAT family N-acetyltransferase [Anaerolineae bacterium]